MTKFKTTLILALSLLSFTQFAHAGYEQVAVGGVGGNLITINGVTRSFHVHVDDCRLSTYHNRYGVHAFGIFCDGDPSPRASFVLTAPNHCSVAASPSDPTYIATCSNGSWRLVRPI